MAERILNSVGTHPYTFTDANAYTYFVALINAGFSQETSDTLYSGASFETIKQGIDNLFIGLKADGIYTKLLKWSPNIGGTEATHAINAITPGTLNSTYSNSPIQNAHGVLFDGTTNWENSGIRPLTNLTTNNYALGAIAVNDDIDLTNTDIFGAQNDGSTATLKFSISNSLSNTFFAPGTNSPQFQAAHGGSNKGFWVATRSSSTASAIHKNGVSLSASSLVSAALTNFEVTIGALNNGAVAPSPRYTGAIRHFFVGTSFTAAQSLLFKNRLKTFDLILNRNILP